jgi:hypothetical protein
VRQYIGHCGSDSESSIPSLLSSSNSSGIGILMDISNDTMIDDNLSSKVHVDHLTSWYACIRESVGCDWLSVDIECPTSLP